MASDSIEVTESFDISPLRHVGSYNRFESERGSDGLHPSSFPGMLNAPFMGRQVSPEVGRRSRVGSTEGRRSRVSSTESIDLENDSAQGPGLITRKTISDIAGVLTPFFRKESQFRVFAWIIFFLACLAIVAENALASLWFVEKKHFVDALAEKDREKSEHFLWVLLGTLPIWVAAETLETLVLGCFKIEWRRFTSGSVIKSYLSSANQAYYRLQFGEGRKVDNPDQRMCEDVEDFVENSVEFTSGLFHALVVLVIFVPQLWVHSQVLTYFLLLFGPVVTLLNIGIFGSRLARWTRLVLKQEANLRFALIRVRENAESIALLRGETFELGRCEGQLSSVLRSLYRRLVVFSTFSGMNVAISSSTILIPAIVMAPQVLAGEVGVGTLIQTFDVFEQVRSALSHCMDNMSKIAEMGAEANRIAKLKATLALDAERKGTAALGEEIVLKEIGRHPDEDGENGAIPRRNGENGDEATRAGGMVDIQTLCLWPPMLHSADIRHPHRAVLTDFSLTLKEGESLLISGESGLGKSSLLRAIGGLWLRGTGSIQRCSADQICFQPQNPYMCLGSLRDQVMYPSASTDASNRPVCSDEEIKAALATANIGYLAERWGLHEERGDFSLTLSLGEQQRLSFTRLLVRPGVSLALLDEATSALDEANEKLLYECLRKSVTTFISVGHRESLRKFHTHSLHLSRSANGASSVKPIRNTEYCGEK